MAGEIRISGGSTKGRRVHSLSGRGVRPTSARVREAIFNIIGARVTGARVLDLFAGVGSLGLEALSRGASHVDFVEKNARHAGVIHANLERLEFASQGRVIRADCSRFLQTGKHGDMRYDLVFLDPPYGEDLLPAVLPGLYKADIISPAGLVVVEHGATREVLDAGPWEVGRSYTYGKTSITLLGLPATDDPLPGD